MQLKTQGGVKTYMYMYKREKNRLYTYFHRKPWGHHSLGPLKLCDVQTTTRLEQQYCLLLWSEQTESSRLNSSSLSLLVCVCVNETTLLVSAGRSCGLYHTHWLAAYPTTWEKKRNNSDTQTQCMHHLPHVDSTHRNKHDKVSENRGSHSTELSSLTFCWGTPPERPHL